MHPPPSPATANFTLMTECTPESSVCYSVYSVGEAIVVDLEQQQTEKIETEVRDVDRIRIKKLYASCPGWLSGES